MSVNMSLAARSRDIPFKEGPLHVTPCHYHKHHTYQVSVLGCSVRLQFGQIAIHLSSAEMSRDRSFEVISISQYAFIIRHYIYQVSFTQVVRFGYNTVKSIFTFP
jgi:hypothetical protein